MSPKCVHHETCVCCGDDISILGGDDCGLHGLIIPILFDYDDFGSYALSVSTCFFLRGFVKLQRNVFGELNGLAFKGDLIM